MIVIITRSNGLFPAFLFILRSWGNIGKAITNIDCIEIFNNCQVANRLHRINQNRKFTSEKHTVTLSEVYCIVPFFKIQIGGETFDVYLLWDHVSFLALPYLF